MLFVGFFHFYCLHHKTASIFGVIEVRNALLVKSPGKD
jgi:hypothetical protein